MMFGLCCLLLMTVALALHRDRRLVEEALASGGAAWVQLVRRLLPILHARTRRWLWRFGAASGSTEVEDVAQQVWLKLLEADGRALRAYDPDRGMSLEGYVGLFAEREAGNLVAMSRAQKRGGGRVELLQDSARHQGDATPNPEHHASERDTLRALLSHLDGELPPKGQLVLRLLYMDGNTPAEVADVLGVSLQVVHNWQHRIRGLARTWQATNG